jgi:sirohydrochlorin ferrochelatase
MVLLFGLVVQAYASDGQIDTKWLLEAISPFIQAILEVVLTVLAAVAAYYVKRYLAQLVERLRQNTTQEQFLMIRIIVDQLVAAAEQLYEDAEGDEKKRYVLEQAERALSEYGLQLDLQMLDALVEAAVFDQFNRPPPIWPDETVTILPVMGDVS